MLKEKLFLGLERDVCQVFIIAAAEKKGCSSNLICIDKIVKNIFFLCEKSFVLYNKKDSLFALKLPHLVQTL